jgi:hypothetical protein
MKMKRRLKKRTLLSCFILTPPPSHDSAVCLFVWLSGWLAGWLSSALQAGWGLHPGTDQQSPTRKAIGPCLIMQRHKNEAAKKLHNHVRSSLSVSVVCRDQPPGEQQGGEVDPTFPLTTADTFHTCLLFVCLDIRDSSL